MPNKSEKTARKTVIVAFVLVILLLIAGTLLRMQTKDMNFTEAMASFVADTFNP